MANTAYTDDQLIAMIRSGDIAARNAALKQIYLAGYNAAKGRIISRGGMIHDAEDAIDNAIIILYKHIRNGKYEQRKGVTLISYFLKVCYLQWLSKKGTGDRIVLTDEPPDPNGQNFETPEVLMLENDIKEQVRKLLDNETLGDRCRQALTMWSWGHNLTKIAQAMNTTYDYARTMLYDCRQKLKKILEKNPALTKQLRDLL